MVFFFPGHNTNCPFLRMTKNKFIKSNFHEFFEKVQMHIFQKKKIQNECYLKKKKSTPWRCVSCGEDKAGGWYCACCTGPRTLLVFFFLNKYQQQKTACFISVCVCVFFFYRGWPYGRKLYINKKTQNIFQLKKKNLSYPNFPQNNFFEP